MLSIGQIWVNKSKINDTITIKANSGNKNYENLEIWEATHSSQVDLKFVTEIGMKSMGYSLAENPRTEHKFSDRLEQIV